MDSNSPETTLNEAWFEVSENEIESVMVMLSKFWPESLKVYNFIKENLELSSRCGNVKIRVFSNNKWHGSVIATAKGPHHVAAIFSPHRNYSSIELAFKGNHVVNWEEGPIIICGISVELYQHLVALSGRKVQLENNEIFDSYWIPAEVATAVDIKCPDDMYLSKLEDIHATVVNSNWPYASEKSLNIISDMIKFKDTVGLFTKKDSKLVSWVINTYYGVGMLHTIEGYRRKGYGSLVMKKIIKILGQSGRSPTIFTLKDNFAAKSVFLSIGFIYIESLKFMKLE